MDGSDIGGDPNTYRPFKLVDSLIAQNVETELSKLDYSDEERACSVISLSNWEFSDFAAPVALVGALTKALCRWFSLSNTRLHELRMHF